MGLRSIGLVPVFGIVCLFQDLSIVCSQRMKGSSKQLAYVRPVWCMRKRCVLGVIDDATGHFGIMVRVASVA